MNLILGNRETRNRLSALAYSPWKLSKRPAPSHSFCPSGCSSRLFRRLFLERLTAAYQAGCLQFFADQAALAQPASFKARLAALRKVKWVVYTKRPFGGPDAVLAYLSRYTHRIAIAK